MASNREKSMDQEAKRIKISEGGMNWSILLEEMSIKQKVELNKSDGGQEEEESDEEGSGSESSGDTEQLELNKNVKSITKNGWDC